VENAGIEIVPRMVVNGGSGEQGGSYSAFEGLMMLLLSEKLGVQMSDGAPASHANTDEIRRLRESILSSASRPVHSGQNGELAESQTAS
jgi:hypothetical protein